MFSDGFIGSLWTIYGRAHKFTSALVFLRTLVLITQHQLPRPVQQISHRLRRYPHLPGGLRQCFAGKNMPNGVAGARRQVVDVDFPEIGRLAAGLLFQQLLLTQSGLQLLAAAKKNAATPARLNTTSVTWQKTGEVISRRFEFSGFPEAMNFVNDVAQLAEQAQHHPDIDIRWNKVTLALTTHDAGGLTDKDYTLA